jgi:hypothetical protein
VERERIGGGEEEGGEGGWAEEERRGVVYRRRRTELCLSGARRGDRWSERIRKRAAE